MTEEEARKLVFDEMEKSANTEFPLSWVGDLVCKTNDVFIFKVGHHKYGQNPEGYALPARVLIASKKVLLPPDFIA